ncbi:exosortase family protein XrtF [Flavobacterium humi]|uniref:Exosortase family protein XrtF n=1 Tax=Flavobacterium humi TaxID=2562683 RepID=A0A4Z0L766_9FLAO|nr:exosortase family protein XrtF [Flavobacterium humi]TGD56953.1 exosortase family protein XrtF [Flavobacterium humi]
MKNYFILYKPFLLFLGKFFLTYLLLASAYQFYLGGFPEGKTDAVTNNVAGFTQQVLQFSDPGSYVREETGQSYFKIYYKQQYIARIIEGCNAISVIILFISFVVAFSGKRKATLLFIFGGSLFVYVLNIFRIALLVMLTYQFPEKEHILHDVFFPLIIYGTVFALWVIWVNKFSKYASKTAQ